MNKSNAIIFKQNTNIKFTVTYSQVLLFFITMFVFSANISYAAETVKYRFGVFPHMTPSYVEKKYSPLALAFSQLLNKPVRLTTANSIDKFRKRINKDKFDIALIPPLDIVPVVDKGGYIPLARKASRAASIVVLDNSKLKKIDDLQGKTLGLPSGTPVNIILQLTLRDRGYVAGKSITFKYFNNVQACLHKLKLKRIDACGSASGFGVKMFQEKMGTKLRAIMKTQAFPHMIYVAHPHLSLAERNALTNAILGQDKTELGKKIFQAIGKKAHFIKYKKNDYDIIRQYRKRWINNAKNTL